MAPILLRRLATAHPLSIRSILLHSRDDPGYLTSPQTDPRTLELLTSHSNSSTALPSTPPPKDPKYSTPRSTIVLVSVLSSLAVLSFILFYLVYLRKKYIARQKLKEVKRRRDAFTMDGNVVFKKDIPSSSTLDSESQKSRVSVQSLTGVQEVDVVESYAKYVAMAREREKLKRGHSLRSSRTMSPRASGEYTPGTRKPLPVYTPIRAGPK